MNLRPFLDSFNLIGFKKNQSKFNVCKLLSKYITMKKNLLFSNYYCCANMLPTIDKWKCRKKKCITVIRLQLVDSNSCHMNFFLVV